MMFDLQSGPCTYRTFLLRGYFASRQGVNKALKKLHQQGLIEPVGTVNFWGEGGNCIVWAAVGSQRWKSNQQKHDVIAFWVVVHLNLTFSMGEEVDQWIRPDAEVWNEDHTVHLWIEVDTGASAYRRIADERLPLYDDQDDPVLWVSCGLWRASDETRKRGLIELAEGRPHHWFVTLDDLIGYSEYAVVENCDGVTQTVSDLLTHVEPVTPKEPLKDAEKPEVSEAQ